MSVAAPYEALVALIEQELQFVGEGRLDELEPLAAARARLQATLPEVPPPDARDALSRALALRRRVTIEILRQREALVLAFAELQQARRAATGYAPVRRRSPRVSASA